MGVHIIITAVKQTSFTDTAALIVTVLGIIFHALITLLNATTTSNTSIKTIIFVIIIFVSTTLT